MKWPVRCQRWRAGSGDSERGSVLASIGRETRLRRVVQYSRVVRGSAGDVFAAALHIQPPGPQDHEIHR